MQNVRVTITNVQEGELDQINTAVSALSDALFHDFHVVVDNPSEYVLTLRPVRWTDVYEVIHSLQRVVNRNRIWLYIH